MMERTNIPTSAACGLWETLLADALDGTLRPEDEATFSGHMATCAACTALFEEARRGREWLEFLSPEPEIPVGLLDRILASTGPGQAEGYGLMPAAADVVAMPEPWQRPGFMGRAYGQARRFAEPRLLMTAAMAFFSIALTLNLTNVRLSGLKLSDLKPTSIRSFMERRVMMASTPIIRYYDHLRFVYEVQTRMRELRRTGEGGATPNQQKEPTPGESKQSPNHKEGGSRVDPPQQSVTPAPIDSELLETSLTFPVMAHSIEESQAQPALSGGSAMEGWERSTEWTA